MVSENNESPTDWDFPHLKYTVMRRWRSVKMLSVEGFFLETKISTFHFNSTVVSVVSKPIWFQLELNLSHSYFEKRSLDCQCSTGVASNVTVQNQSVMRMMVLRVD
jgi:hypothetical protein